MTEEGVRTHTKRQLTQMGRRPTQVEKEPQKETHAKGNRWRTRDSNSENPGENCHC